MPPNLTVPFFDSAGPIPKGLADTVAGAPRDPSTLVGQHVDGKYEITEVLGAGAMAVVLAARHIFLEKEVAIKVLHPSVLAVPGVRERFVREARATSGIKHERVVTVTDFGVTEQGYHYLVMERLHGQSLFDWSEGRIPIEPTAAASIGAMVADGLSAVHAAGFVHRDIKPENLFVTSDGGSAGIDIKILDLGVAGIIRDAALAQPAARLTQADMTVGTVYYMAPEQATASEVDGRTDIYALGCVLWGLLTGKVLFDADTHHGVLMHHLGTDPEPPSTYAPAVPGWLDEVVLCCLAKHPDDRFATAAELREALTPPREDIASLASDLVSGSDLFVAPRKKRWPVAVGAVMAAGLVAFLLLPLGKGAPDKPARGVEALAVKVPTEKAPAPQPVKTRPVESAVGSRPAASSSVTPPVIAPKPAVLSFEIEPHGTEIQRNNKIIGVSPLTVTVQPEDGHVRYTMTHDGYIPFTIEFEAEATRTIKRTLEILPSPVASEPVKPNPTSTTPVAVTSPPIKTKPRRVVPEEPEPTTIEVTPEPLTAPTQPANGLWRPKRPESTP